MSENKSQTEFSFIYLVNAQHKMFKTNVILVYGHVDILWTYKGAKTKMMILAWVCLFEQVDHCA